MMLKHLLFLLVLLVMVGESAAYELATPGTFKLNSILDPDGNTSFSLGTSSVSWTFSNPASNGFIISVLGAYSGHALHVHQETGNPGTSVLAHFEADDPDVLPLEVVTNGTRATVATFRGARVDVDSLDADGEVRTGALDVTGNITVSGTVDGVDIAALAAEIDTLHFIFAILNPNATYDTDVRFCFKPVLPSAITITRIDVTCDADPTTEPAMSLKYADAFIGLANAVTIDVITTTNGVTEITSGFDNASVPTGKALYFESLADPEVALKSITVDMAYTVN